MPFGFPKRSIKYKLIGLLLAISVLPVLILTTVNLVETGWNRRVDMHRSFQFLTEHLSEKIDGTTRRYLDEAETLSNSQATRRLLNNSVPDEALRSDPRAEIRTLISRDHAIENVFILDRKSQLCFAFKSETDEWRPFFSSAFSEPISSPNIVAVESNGRGNRAHFVAASPVGEPAAQHLGTVLLLFNGDEVWDAVNRYTGVEGPGSFGVLVDENGMVIANGFDRDASLSLIAPLDDSTKASLIARARYGPETQSMVNAPRFVPPFDLPLETGSTPARTFESRDANGEKVDVVTCSLRTVHWKVCYLVPESALSQPVYSSVRKLILIAFAVLLVTLVIGVLASRGVTKPLDSLRQAVEQMKAGNFNVRVPIAGDDEVATLARSFQEMAERLQRTIHDLNQSNQGYRNLAEHLEQRVEQRTNDYRMANQRLIHFAHREQFLHRVASLLRSSLDISKVLPAAAEEVRRALDVTRAIVACSSPSMFVAATVEDQRRDSPTIPESMLRDALLNGTSGPIVIHDLFHYHPPALIHPDIADGLLSANVRSLLVVPIVSRGKHLGSINLHQCYHARNWDAEEIALVESVARQFSDSLAYVALFEEVEQQALTIQSKNEELEQFVYTVSHDLKAPLVSLQGLSQILLEDYAQVLDEDGQHYLNRLQMNAHHLEKLIQGLLELSRVSRVSETVEPVDARQVVETVIDQFCFQIADRGVEMCVQERLPAALSERSQLEQVFANLISNALKFLGTDNPQPRIEIGGAYRDGMSEYWVKDNGIGIDPQFHQKIFGMFHRLEELPEAEGTGIGLAIVQRIVEKHGGKIWIESKRGEGAAFHFTIASSHLLLSEPLSDREQAIERRSGSTVRRLRESRVPAATAGRIQT